ncbi:MAG: DNA-binding domain-containing protein, partial [Candidatus Thiodiazotropha taylori]
MSLLAELQKSFCDALRTAETPDGALLAMLQDDDLALQRFQVYRNNFIVLNGDALADMFPVVKRLVGEEAFRMLATAYVRQHPPRDRTLLLYGDLFADFLQAIPELSELP